MPFSNPLQWSFDIDRYINPIIPHPPFDRLPRVVSRFLGHRHETAKPIGNLAIIFCAFLGVFASIIVIEAASDHVPYFEQRGSPIIIASFGAAAVLEFYSIDSPLAQPRNAVLGQILSAVIGTAVCKLFALSDNFESIRWIGGALACACAVAVMALTKTVHPPAGATALLAVVDDDAFELGWSLIPLMMLGCALMQTVALLVNNVLRRFPLYWWTPEEVGSWWRRSNANPDHTMEAGSQFHEVKLQESATNVSHNDDRSSGEPPENHIVISRGLVTVPEHIYITVEEKLFLESLSERI